MTIIADLLGHAAPDRTLSPLALRRQLEAACPSTDDLIAQLKTATLSEPTQAHVANCARCCDRVHLIGHGFGIAKAALDIIAPEPPCDAFDLTALLAGVTPITDHALHHLRVCAPCRQALVELFNTPTGAGRR